jgi:hypothetical protein
MVDAYTTMAGATERARRREERSLSKNTLSPAKSSASSRSKKKSNSQSDSSSRRDIAPIKVASGSIKSTKPVAQTVGGFAESVNQPLEEFAGPADTITPSIEPVPSDSKLHTSRPPSPIRPPNFISESLLGIRADKEPENVS